MANEITARISLVGGDQVKRAFAELAQAAQAAVQQIRLAGGDTRLAKAKDEADQLSGSLKGVGIAANDARRALGGTANSAGPGLDTANQKTETFIATLKRLAIAAASFIAVKEAVQGFNALVTASGESAAAIGNNAEKTGLAVSEYQKLIYAGQQLGVSADDTSRGFEHLSDAIDIAQQGLNKFGTTAGEKGVDRFGSGVDVLKFSSAVETATATQDKFAKRAKDIQAALKELRVPLIGVTEATQDLSDSEEEEDTASEVYIRKQRDKIAVYGDIIAALQKLPDGAKKARLENLFFGDSAKALQPILSATTAELADYYKQFDATGRALTSDQAANAQEFVKAQKDLQSAIRATRDQLGLLFVPGRTATMQFYAGIVDATRSAIVNFVALQVAATKAFVSDPENQRRFIDGLRTAIGFLGELGRIIRISVLAAFDAFDTALSIVVQGIKALTGVDVSKQFLAAAAGLFALVGGFSSLTVFLGPIAAVLATIVGLFTGLGPLAYLAGFAVTAFWDDFERAAVAAYTVVTSKSVEFRRVLEFLKRGEFRAAWEEFKGIALDTFRAVEAAAPGVGNAVREALGTITGFGANARAVFATFRGFLNIIAFALNGIFGTNLTASGVVFYAILLRISGVMGLLANSTFILANLVKALGGAWAFIAFTIGPIIARNFEAIRAIARQLGDALAKIFRGDIVNGISGIGAAIRQLWALISSGSVETWAVFLAGITVAAVQLRGLVALAATAFGGIVGAAKPAGARFAPLLLGGIRGGLTAETLAGGAAAGLATGTALSLLIFGVGITAAVAYFWTDLRAEFERQKRLFQTDFKDELTVDATGQTFENGKPLKTENFNQMWDMSGLPQTWSEVGQSIRSVYDSLNKTNGAIGDLSSSIEGIPVPQETADAFAKLETEISATGAAGPQQLNPLELSLQRIRDTAREAASAISDLFTSSGGSTSQGIETTIPQFAGGGYISGPGTATSDSILARLSNGEFVVRAAAVEHYGPNLLHAINQLRVPKFANGGLVGALRTALAVAPIAAVSPAMAAQSFNVGQQANNASGRPVILNIGGESFTATAAPDVAERLARYAAKRMTASAGRRPSWVGG